MAAAPSAPASPSPPEDPLDEDLSSMSSPLESLSDVDDEKDEGAHDIPDEMHVDNDADEPVHDEDDSKSDLSDANDTEAETERLYDTPQHPRQKDVVVDQFNNGQVFEHTPSKLQKTLAAGEGPHPADDHDADEESDDDVSMATSHDEDEDPTPSKPVKSRNATPLDDAKSNSQERKRKRSPVAEQSDPEQPLRKRTGSVGAPVGEHKRPEDTVGDDEALSGTVPSGDHSVADEAIADESHKDEPTPEDDTASNEPLLSKKLTRNGIKRKGGDEVDTGDKDELEVDLHEDAGEATHEEDVDHPAEDDGAEADAEEDAEAAAKNAEELERKRLAFEDWSELEEKFGLFRDRDRLEKLEQEEQSLLADEPTHVEFLNMKQCLDDRLELRIRQIEKEHELKIEALGRVSVAQRAQIFGQFYQSVRESREAVLENLNEEWYEIQNRRRSAHSVQDYGLLFPSSHTQRVRNAVAYNTEVSYLSGIAKYRGFPAGPVIRSASTQEVEDDLEAMKRGRRTRQPSAIQPLEEHALLGPAGEQFIRNTPWANPNHASHRSSVSALSGGPVGKDGLEFSKQLQQALPSYTAGTSKATSSQSKKANSHSSGSGKASKGGAAAPAVKTENAVAVSS